MFNRRWIIFQKFLLDFKNLKSETLFMLRNQLIHIIESSTEKSPLGFFNLTPSSLVSQQKDHRGGAFYFEIGASRLIESVG
jgi:hypothetical protein